MRSSVPEQVTTSPPVQAPYRTYSSATDAPAAFGQSGQQFGISGAGAGLFVTSGTAGDPGQATFDGFGVTATADTPALATSYEAEALANTLADGAVVQSCPTCSGGAKVGYVGEGGALTFNGIDVPTAGTYRVTLIYATDGARPAVISANENTGTTLSFPTTGSFTATGALTVSLALNAGANTIELSDPTAYAPDFDRLIIAAAPADRRAASRPLAEQRPSQL